MTIDQIHQISVVGAGTMGASIGFCFAKSGYRVSLYSRSTEGLSGARNRIQRNLDLFVHEGILASDTASTILARIKYTTDLEACLRNSDFVIESTPEDLELKQSLFQQMDVLCPHNIILATNTSGLSITDIASVCQIPNRVIGLHWINPAHIIPLVEVIRGKLTDDSAIQTTYCLSEQIDKIPVIIRKDIPGFASNRLQFALFREALHLVETGVISVQDADRLLQSGVGFRYPWLGAFKTADLGGLDIFLAISDYLFKNLSKLDRPPSFFRNLVSDGKLGLKTGHGFYSYSMDQQDKILQDRDTYFIRQLNLIREMSPNDSRRVHPNPATGFSDPPIA